MKTSGPSILTCLVIVTSALAWIAGVSYALVYFCELPEITGWWIAGSLGFSSVVAITVILYEMRHAVDISPTATELGLDELMEPTPWTMPRVGNGQFSKA